jgi:hypothetical protein
VREFLLTQKEHESYFGSYELSMSELALVIHARKWEEVICHRSIEIQLDRVYIVFYKMKPDVHHYSGTNHNLSS